MQTWITLLPRFLAASYLCNPTDRIDFPKGHDLLRDQMPCWLRNCTTICWQLNTFAFFLHAIFMLQCIKLRLHRVGIRLTYSNTFKSVNLLRSQLDNRTYLLFITLDMGLCAPYQAYQSTDTNAIVDEPIFPSKTQWFCFYNPVTCCSLHVLVPDTPITVP